MVRIVREMFVFFMFCFGIVYLMFPTLGIFELIPDVIPVVGNIDEAGATLLIVNALNYWGLDLTTLMGTPKKRTRSRVIQLPAGTEQDDV